MIKHMLIFFLMITVFVIGGVIFLEIYKPVHSDGVFFFAQGYDEVSLNS